MAGKKKTESSAVEEARKTVAAADREDRRNQEKSTEICNCNAHGGPHRHLDSGVEPAVTPPAVCNCTDTPHRHVDGKIVPVEEEAKEEEGA